jgi:hypothetical protein
VELTNETIRDGEAAAHTHESMLKCGDVVGHCYYVLERGARNLIKLEEQQIG